MKLYIIPGLFILFLAACTSKKGAVASTNPTTSTEPTEKQLQVLQAKYPMATMEELKQGHALYYGTCTGCHGAKNTSSFSENDWPGILENMATKAKVTSTEKDAIFKYVMAVKLEQPK